MRKEIESLLSLEECGNELLSAYNELEASMAEDSDKVRARLFFFSFLGIAFGRDGSQKSKWSC
jgi:hypothetical protein